MNESERTTQKSAGTYILATWSIAAISFMSTFARFLIVDLTRRRTAAMANPGILIDEPEVARCTSSSASLPDETCNHHVNCQASPSHSKGCKWRVQNHCIEHVILICIEKRRYRA
mmetsp:Transcript_5408/g.18375  ORF Transcript_5408/g.18375 Transcript_5408/m.18375 type:complete len:115 (+) Transcript_5408:926-1270(+)